MSQVTRREFMQTASVAALGASLPTLSTRVLDAEGAGEPWYGRAYRRAVIDMHIPDWDDRFLSKLDIRDYVRLLKQAKAQSVVAYAQSHTGLFNYPTKVGRQHKALVGRDVVREMLDGCHAEGIAVILYVSVIHDRWAGDNHPEWGIIDADGKPFGLGSRHGFSCPNSPYRDYVRSWVEEICERYDDFDGVRFDMTFWTTACYCRHCRTRFADEVGGDIPKVVNWLDPAWVAFIRKREEWLGEFAALCTSTVKATRPHATVEHQASTYPLGWTFGVATPLIDQNDFLQGDFYGDSWQGSFVRKLLECLTPHRPYGFETSFCIELQDHTGMKSEALLEAKASAAIADNAAFIFIDGIDPMGTLNPMVYERMERIFSRLMPCYEHLGGERVADIAVYYSLESKLDFAANGLPVGAPDAAKDAHTVSVISIVKRLVSQHVPFGFITKHSLDRLGSHKVLILPQVCMMTFEEAEAIRQWVKNGGRLMATGWSSVVDTGGHLQPDFMLGDVFGVRLVEPHWKPWPHYVAPTDLGKDVFDHFSPAYPPFAKCAGMRVEAHRGAIVLATTTLPWPAPESRMFASIHSDPPWEPTDRPELVLHAYGRGQCLYSASSIETLPVFDPILDGLIAKLGGPWSFEVDAPSCVEATMFHQPDRSRYLLNLVNFQRDLPNIPVHDIGVRLRLPHAVSHIVHLPNEEPVEYTTSGDGVVFTCPRLDTLAMFAVEVTR